MWEALLIFRPIVAQAILSIVVPKLEPISPPKRMFNVTKNNLGIMVTCRIRLFHSVLLITVKTPQHNTAPQNTVGIYSAILNTYRNPQSIFNKQVKEK
ncbi:hypothetical protein E2C01_021992 [Portunus trituberculatus]|uniref:Uncharacterized protein n=1 Tax=Portunus trituberculatus TaxID=210409 RepID=A0A5B7E426_PORTR|nr:hypothetical protein [Portunus trituberculatus]